MPASVLPPVFTCSPSHPWLGDKCIFLHLTSNKQHSTDRYCCGYLLCQFYCLSPHIAHHVIHLTLDMPKKERTVDFSFSYRTLSPSPTLSAQSVVLLEAPFPSAPPCRHPSGLCRTALLAELQAFSRKAPMQSWWQDGGSALCLTAAPAWFLVEFSVSMCPC